MQYGFGGNYTDIAFCEYFGISIKEGVVSRIIVKSNSTDEWAISHNDEWHDIIKICAGRGHIVALRNDGKVFAIGDNSSGQCLTDSWKNIIDIKAFSDITYGVDDLGDEYIAGQLKSISSGFCGLSKTKKPLSNRGNHSGDSFKKNDKESLLNDFLFGSDGDYGQCLIKYHGKNKFVDLSEFDNITSIGPYAFHKSSISYIALSQTIKAIGRRAFERCKGLQKIEMNSFIQEIQEGAFYACSSLSEVILPSSLIYIGKYAFASCERLAKIIIPQSVTQIDNDAFIYSDKCVIYTTKDSFAERYALERNVLIKYI